MPELVNARLVLEDGSVFEGKSFGFEESVSGEVVFNTGMVGYPESLTDPSYNGQILALTYPLVGNYGVPKQEKDGFGLEKAFESGKIQVSGLIVADYSFEHSHWKAEKSLSDWLKAEKVAGLTGIDCRALTKRLREKGVMLGKIVFGQDKQEFVDPNERNLASEVSCSRPEEFGEGKPVFALLDCGVKNNIVRSLVKRSCKVIKFPLDYDIFNGKHKFDAVFVSNGPGNPKKCTKAIESLKKALELEIPTFGICFGNQLLGLAAGADTYKLKYGHRSQNQPCVSVGTKRCFITSQNHGYAVDEKTLPSGWKPWFRNLNDGTNEGIRHKTKPFMSVQFHPEARPGPVDTAFLFDEFIKIAREAKR